VVVVAAVVAVAAVGEYNAVVRLLLYPVFNNKHISIIIIIIMIEWHVLDRTVDTTLNDPALEARFVLVDLMDVVSPVETVDD